MTIATINGSEMYYHTKGSGVPLMILHGGLGLDHTYLAHYFDQLSDVAELIYFDHRGNGRSERPDDYGSITMRTLVDDVDGLRAHLGHEQVVVFGHSYGGFIGQEYAIAYPERVKGLILTSTVPAFDYHPEVSGTDEQMAAFGAAFSGPMASDEDWRNTWNTLSQMYFRKFDPAVGDKLDSETVYSADAWNTANPLLATYNTLAGLPSLTMPTLNIGGRYDGIALATQGAERIHSLMPNSTLKVFENSAHYPFIEEEAAFFETVRAWLASL